MQRLTPHRSHVLADAIEDDDRVVGRVAGHGQDRGDDVQREVVLEEREEGERHEQIVNGRDDGAEREGELETECDIGQDPEQRQHHCRGAFPGQVLADRGADDFSADDRELRQPARAQRVFDPFRRDAQRGSGFGADFGHPHHYLSL
jgi:hypothetical protein